jgi:hypothetical protein
VRVMVVFGTRRMAGNGVGVVWFAKAVSVVVFGVVCLAYGYEMVGGWE